VSAVAKESVGAVVWRLWRDPAAWATTVDISAALTVASLPWSTSLVAIFATALLVSMAPFLDVKAFLRSLKRPVCVLPMALFALAVAGTLWSDAPWDERLYAVGPTAKLLMLPVLLYHFEHSARGAQVLIAFLVSCALLMMVSWIVAFDPGLALKPAADAERGIFVKNHIDQSQEFALCAVALAYPIVASLRANRILPAVLLIAVSLSFVVNMLFVVVSRTALVTMPIMFAVFAMLHLKWRATVVISCAVMGLAALAWLASPQLRPRTAKFVSDYQQYKEENRATSIGLRIEYWQKSLRFIAEAPIIGHGTGSTRGLFERAATGPELGVRSALHVPEQYAADRQVVANPHNQSLNAAIQWGAIGVVGLYAMWLVHLLLFRGEGLATWLGLMVVVQNIFTSLFNSHLFDFHEGWMYVLGVGIAGGMVLGKSAGAEATGTRNSVEP
jgi:O-antigen ligase